MEQLAPDLEQKINKGFLVSEINIPELRQACVNVAQMISSAWLFTWHLADSMLANGCWKVFLLGTSDS